MTTSAHLMGLSPAEAIPRMGMIAAFRWEVKPMLRKQTRVKQLHQKLYSFCLGEEPVVLAIAGAGKENSFRAALDLIRNFHLRGLFTLGFAGALVNSLEPGDVILADRIVESGTRDQFPCQTDLLPIRCIQRGSLLSVNEVIHSAAEKRRLGEGWGAVAVDMESAGVARAAGLAGLPVCAVKSITDSSDQSISVDFQRCRSEHGGLSVLSILGEALRSPQGFRDLWRLVWSARLAAQRLASALDPI